MFKSRRAARAPHSPKISPRPAPWSMSGVQLAALASCLAAMGLLGAGSFLTGKVWLLALAAAAGLAWLLALALRKERTAAGFFILFVLVAAAGRIAALPPAWQLASILAALAAWDLGSFAHRLDGAARIEKRSQMVQRHVLRLLAVLALGLALGGSALGLRLSLGFIPALILAALLLASLIAVIAFMRRKTT